MGAEVRHILATLGEKLTVEEVEGKKNYRNLFNQSGHGADKRPPRFLKCGLVV